MELARTGTRTPRHRVKLLIDVNLSSRWARLFTEAGIEALHWTQVGLPDASDNEVMAFAASNHFVVLTKDLDYGAMLAASGNGQPSVVQLRLTVLQPAAALFGRLLSVLQASEADLEAGALLTVDAKRVRLKILPFTPRYPPSL